jgi:hypothetical protein
MKPSDVFALVVRVFGLALTLYSLWSVVTNIAFSLSVEGSGGGGMGWFVLSAILSLAVGIYLLRGASHLVRFSYPNG